MYVTTHDGYHWPDLHGIRQVGELVCTPIHSETHPDDVILDITVGIRQWCRCLISTWNLSRSNYNVWIKILLVVQDRSILLRSLSWSLQKLGAGNNFGIILQAQKLSKCLIGRCIGMEIDSILENNKKLTIKLWNSIIIELFMTHPRWYYHCRH